MSERLICIVCPIGCELVVDLRGGTLDVSGQQCDKGIRYAEQEILNPLRNLATSVPIRGTAARMVSVRLSKPVPRDRIFSILAEIATLRPDAPVRRGQVLIPDVLGTGADVIATRTVRD